MRHCKHCWSSLSVLFWDPCDAVPDSQRGEIPAAFVVRQLPKPFNSDQISSRNSPRLPEGCGFRENPGRAAGQVASTTPSASRAGMAE